MSLFVVGTGEFQFKVSDAGSQLDGIGSNADIHSESSTAISDFEAAGPMGRIPHALEMFRTRLQTPIDVKAFVSLGGPKDSHSDAFLSAARNQGVEFHDAVRAPGARIGTKAIVPAFPEGTFTAVSRQPKALGPIELPFAEFGAGDILGIFGQQALPFSFTSEFRSKLEAIKNRGCTVILSPGSYAADFAGLASFYKLAPLADVVILNEESARIFFPSMSAKQATHYAAKTFKLPFITTLGTAGCAICHPETRVTFLNGASPNHGMTEGCGAIFAAAFLARFNTHRDVFFAARDANYLAGAASFGRSFSEKLAAASVSLDRMTTPVPAEGAFSVFFGEFGS